MTVDDLTEGHGRGGLTRAELLRRSAALAGVVAGGSVLAACSAGGGDGTAATASASAAAHEPMASSWQISNWPNFIDTDDDGGHPSVDSFNAQYDTDTVYTEDVTSNEAVATRYAPLLAEGQDIGLDAVVLSDWMAYQWVQAGYARRLDPTLLPHVSRLRIKPLTRRPVDPADEYLVPWQAGLTGVIYDPAKTVGDLSRINDLFDPDFPGTITLLDNMRDTLGMVMLANHVNPGTCTADQAQAAADRIRTQLVEKGRVERFAGGDYVDDLAEGKVAAAFGWSTDYERLVQANPALRFMVASEGCLIWSDDILIPIAAQHPQNAHRFADYYYNPNTAALVTKAVRYTTPLNGTKTALAKIDPSDPLLTSDPELPGPTRVSQLTFLQGRILDQAKGFRGLSPAEEKTFTDIFSSAKG
jgi:spermidine/putrescine transport system substrate-binding protein